jgi:hypothetical protein
MGGGLMQLVAYGAQDIYLTGNPQITFFKVVYRRHTNFSMEAIEQTINGTPATNGRSTVTISRNGDLVGRCYLQSTCASTQVVNSAVTNLSSVELEIGGQKIDKQTGHWMQTWAELTENKTGRGLGTNFQNMSGYGSAVAVNEASDIADNGTDATVVHFATFDQVSAIQWTPLQFWFCRNPGLALPLIALQYHEVKLIFNFGTLTHTGHKVWCDYIYLDTDERRRFAQVSHEYLIEQVQEQAVTASTSSQSEDLNFNHPVKELVWAGGFSSGALTQFAGDASETVQLKLNGHDRFSARERGYFSRVQVYQHHTGEGGFADGSVGVYSFALKPEEHQPSGTCNFSRIDNAQLTFSAGFETTGTIYAVNYNVLRIMSGMGGLAYSN